MEERYADCDICGARYWGEDAIRSYLKEVEAVDAGETVTCCKGHRKERVARHIREEFGAQATE